MLEEIDDVDDMDFDPSDFDPRKVLEAVPSGPNSGGARLQPSSSSSTVMSARANPIAPSAGRSTPMRGGMRPQYTVDESQFKEWQILYPVYFDARRTHQEGRRVNKELAVENPLAQKIAEACAALPLQTFLEPQKLHPKDWSNPGRVRVLIRDPETGKLQNPNIKNKRDLYRQIAMYLQDHPTAPDDALKLPIPGLPADKAPEKPAVPRGWKMNDVLPLHSNALTGGGVNENIFKDLAGGLGGIPGMEGLANGKLPPGLAGLPGGLKGLEGLGGLNGLQGLGGLGGLGQLAAGLGGMGGMGGMGGAQGGRSGRKSRK
ncbi:signal recognition particle, SRP19 subunit [Lipomyces oligophaga]|uniref:signal recognition particle, SRP19 subunit n=1 Tax=Lipomyces oligophaga TaxID=45792 RepID=UPI0034D00B9D